MAGRYCLEELHGRGPMSEVWRAHDRTLDRAVALKVLSPAADLERFRREAQALATLAHENVMRVYDYGQDEAGPFMALEWLAGGTLEDRLQHGPLPPDETHRFARGMAAGLAHLHARGLVHRDLKPANVLFDEEGRPKLGDFGLARSTAASGTLTEAGTVLGTAAYISPEQAAGEPAGSASDVYSFGVILFRMLTGALPFTADSALALVDLHRRAPPPAVEAVRPDAPPELAGLTAAALRKDPVRRPADGRALLAALGSASTSPAAVSEGEPTRILTATATRPARGVRRGTAAAGAAVVLLAAAGGVLAWAVAGAGGPAAPAGTGSTGSVAGTGRPSSGSTTHPVRAESTRTAASTRAQQRTTTAPRTTAPTTTAVPPRTRTTPTTTTAAPTTTTTTTAPTTTTSTTAGGGTTTGATVTT